MRPGIESAIARALAYAPYADMLWCETSTPDLDEARDFAEAVHAEFPGKLLAYNCSPSFNWKKSLDDATIATFQKELGAMGYRFQFITLAGFHSLNASMFDLAKGYAAEGMTAYVKLQQHEFALEPDGYTAVKHQARSRHRLVRPRVPDDRAGALLDARPRRAAPKTTSSSVASGYISPMKIARFVAVVVGLSLVASVPPAWAAGGDPDTSFSGDGVLTYGLAVGEESGVGAEIDPSGRLVVGQYLYNTDLAVARILRDGTLDPHFNGGITQFPDGKARPTNAVAVQGDGKVLVVGSSANADLDLVRYRANGLPDQTFGTDGHVHMRMPSTSTTETNIFVRSDDSIVVTGYFESASTVNRMFVLAFKPGGGLDTSFAGDGAFLALVGDDTTIRDAMLDGRDRITLIGDSEANGKPTRAIVARLLPNGTFDRSFAGDGVAVFDLAGGDDHPRAIDALGGGSVLVVEQGVNAAGTGANAVSFEVTGAGKLDTSYSGNGTSALDLDTFDNPQDLWIDGNGRAYIATSLPLATTSVPTLIRTKPSGALDTSFSTDGIAQVTTEGIGAYVTPWRGKPTIIGDVFLTTDFDVLVARFLA